MNYTGNYPDKWAGYIFCQWSALGYYHEGVDFNRGGCDEDLGDDIYACSDGVVAWVGFSEPGYGAHVYIKHSNGKDFVFSHYAHLERKSILFGPGEKVESGQKIAKCGHTGWPSMCAHLHFEIFTEEHWENNVRPSLDANKPFWPNPNKGWNELKIKSHYHDPFKFIADRQKIETEDDPELSLDEKVKLKTEINKLRSKLDDEAKKFLQRIARKEEHIQKLLKEASQNALELTELKKRHHNLLSEKSSILSKHRPLEDKIKGLESGYKKIRKENLQFLNGLTECQQRVLEFEDEQERDLLDIPWFIRFKSLFVRR